MEISCKHHLNSSFSSSPSHIPVLPSHEAQYEIYSYNDFHSREIIISRWDVGWPIGVSRKFLLLLTLYRKKSEHEILEREKREKSF